MKSPSKGTGKKSGKKPPLPYHYSKVKTNVNQQRSKRLWVT